MQPYDDDLTGVFEAAIAADAVDRLDLPHVVYVFDRLLHEPTVIGPFADPISASRYAERYRGEVLPPGTDPAVLEICVIPMEPGPAVRGRTSGRRR